MQDDQALSLRPAKRSDFRLAAIVLTLLVFLSAILSSYPIILISLVIVILLMARYFSTLSFYKVTGVKLISIIFPAGKVRLDCDSEGIIEGVLSGGQWCTRHAAVLRIVSKQRGVQNLLVLSKHQESAHEFRRLLTWLRLGADKRDRQRELLAS